MIRIIITFANNFLAFFIVFEWGRSFENAIDTQEVKCNAKLRPNYFSVKVSVLAVSFHRKISSTNNFRKNCPFFKICRQNTTASTETFTEKSLGRNSALHFTSYLFTALSKILPHSKTIKSIKKLLVFSKNDSRRLSNFSQTHIFWNFYHIFRS